MMKGLASWGNLFKINTVGKYPAPVPPRNFVDNTPESEDARDHPVAPVVDPEDEPDGPPSLISAEPELDSGFADVRHECRSSCLSSWQQTHAGGSVQRYVPVFIGRRPYRRHVSSAH